jgi:chemotaxis protein methyltransferase WspC
MSVDLDLSISTVLAPISQLLRQKIGIDPQIMGDRAIARAIETCFARSTHNDLSRYLNSLPTSAQALDELIEQIVIPETYFFRDRKPFEYLIQQVKARLISPPLNILSIPCSTGEEPYSIAIAFLEAGLASHQLQIDAIDISHRAITKAKRGVYGKNSFRGDQWIPADRYFQSSASGHAVTPTVRNLVNFRQGNLLDQFTRITVKYDIIFCRNLLIYLDSAVCQQTFTTLWNLLQPAGLLFIGASETGKVDETLFKSLRQPFTFGYQKVQTNPTPALITPDISPIAPSRAVKPKIERNRSATPRAAPADIQQSEPVNSLTIAQQLADRGKIEAAITQCQICLKQESTNAAVYTLLGTLHQAKSEPTQAEIYLRKALYLNPHDYDALTHLALLKESLGDTDGAKMLQQRIQKLP